MKLLLVVADSVRVDAVDLAPFGGVDLPRAYCAGSWTIPSLVSMVTGELPTRVGVANWLHRRWAGEPASPVHRSLYARLAGAGFAVDLLVPNPASAFAGWSGVDSVGDSLDPEVVRTTLARPGPRFVLLHHWWTHLPYLPPPRPPRVLGWSGLHEAAELALTALARDPDGARPGLRRLYLAAARRLAQVDLLAWLDAFGDGWVVVTADHGESWGEHAPGGRPRHIFDLHGRWLNDDTTRVPLRIFSTRRELAEGTLDRVVSGVDVGPTLAALAGVRWEGSRGRSVFDGGDREAVTVGGANCETPDHYPETGPALWPYWSVRTREGRRTGDAEAVGLAAERAAAVDPGPMPEDWRVRRDRHASRHARVFGALRRLGYVEE